MATQFRPVPDWFSFDNAGGGVAVAGIDGGAGRDLVVLAVDSPPGRNRGVYRIGRALDAEGEVTGGWTPWLDVPDWEFFENQGAGIAVADLTGGGDRDLVVATVDNPAGGNRGLYRIGRGLDGTGAATGGWTPWRDVPDWFSWENQGIAIAVTPPDPQERRDLVVFMVDNPGQLNAAKYRLGRGLDADGNVSGGWTPWLDVPGWFSWENAGCGVAVVDLDRDGGRDLIIFHIDNAIGQNQAFYRVGRDLADDGTVGGGWGPWLGVPHWFSHENSGGGIAVTELAGRRRLVAFMVDNPPERNAGLYQVLDLDADPARQGAWEELRFRSGVLAVHAALLPKGKVLFFAGSGSSRTRFDSPIFGDVDKGIFTSVVWDPPGNSFAHPATLRAGDHRPFDFFCGGDTFLADGRLLSAGGTRAYEPGFQGRRDVAVFDPAAGQWSFAASMHEGRWYPTLTTLADGGILAATGLGENGGDGPKRSVEIYHPADNTWHLLHLGGGLAGLPLYAHLFLLADGRVFFSGGRMDDPIDVQPSILDIKHDPVPAVAVPDLLDPDTRNQSASVLLPPAQQQKVMVIGGGPVGKPDKTSATDAVSVVDLTAAQPHYVAAAPLGLPRLHLNAVLLPDRTVFVGGGALHQEDEPLARLQAEIYDPKADAWSLMAPAAVPRLYHSTALLLPDGRVLAAGGNPEGGHQVAWEPPDDEEEMRLEIFSPPYLFRGPRPVITSVPEKVVYGQRVTIATPRPDDIAWVSLIRPGVTTHSFDSDQRLVDLEITQRGGQPLTVAVPDNANLAPSGWYMLFLVDRQGVPSTAAWVHLTA